jgi:hypothetical protein
VCQHHPSPTCNTHLSLIISHTLTPSIISIQFWLSLISIINLLISQFLSIQLIHSGIQMHHTMSRTSYLTKSLFCHLSPTTLSIIFLCLSHSHYSSLSPPLHLLLFSCLLIHDPTHNTPEQLSSTPMTHMIFDQLFATGRLLLS